MKKIYIFMLLLLSITTLITAQKTADLFIENATVNGSKFSWEIHITPTNDWGADNRKALGDCSWYFDYNSSALANPVLKFVAPEVATADGYTNTTGVTGDKVQATTDLDIDNYDGVNLTVGTKYHIYTIEMDITDASKQAEITWDQINTGIFNGRDASVNESYFGNGDILLPVELTTFSAIVNGNNIELSWSTATEVNNSGFNVERKMEEEEWQTVAFIKGSGNSNSPKNYSYSDENVLAGKYYYRLKQKDIDGTFEYSQIVEAAIEIPEKFEVPQNYPNPFNPTTTISFSLPAKSNVQVVVYNTIGELISTLINKELNAGVHKINFDGSKLTSGIYLYNVKTENNAQTHKMILMK